MKTIITYCSGPKLEDACLLPAVDRYLSPRIHGLHRMARKHGHIFLILSGEFGIVEPDQPIPWYDHLLLPSEVPELVPKVATVLAELEPESVQYYSADPAQYQKLIAYRDLIAGACRVLDIPLEIVPLPGNPD